MKYIKSFKEIYMSGDQIDPSMYDYKNGIFRAGKDVYPGWSISTITPPPDTEYLYCRDCESHYKIPSSKSDKCRNCGSLNIILLTEDEYKSKLEN